MLVKPREKKTYSINLDMGIVFKLKELSKKKYGNENLSRYINEELELHTRDK